jgi:hypothetical protein
MEPTRTRANRVMGKKRERMQQSVQDGQGDLFSVGCEEETLVDQGLALVREIVAGGRQPTAPELLESLQHKLGWRVRHVFCQISSGLRGAASVNGLSRSYAQTVLSEDEVEESLSGGARPDPALKSTIDDLVRSSALYRTSEAFTEAVEFCAKFRDYAPFNNMLVRLQRPGCCFYATAKDWDQRFSRMVKEDAIPIVILAPMHPVMLVYDVDSTEGDPLPEHFDRFAEVQGDFEGRWLERTLINAERLRILVQRQTQASSSGGFATRAWRDAHYKMRVVVRKELESPSTYGVLCHELAHILLGHLGSDRDNWWPCRMNLPLSTIELEAETVSYIVSVRRGLETRSAAYLATHDRDGKAIKHASLDLIMKVAARISEMGDGLRPERETKDELENRKQENV